MSRDPYADLSGDELDPQASESEQLAALGMREVSDADPAEDEEEEEEAGTPVDVPEPVEEVEKDGLTELEEMEQRLRAEEPTLDFAIVEEE